jgi:hypothetical protein
MEQRVAFKFCFKLGKTASETYDLLKKSMEVVLCLVKRHLNGLNDFERVGCCWRMMMEKSRVETMFVFFDAQSVIHCEFVPEGQTVNGQLFLFRCNGTVTEAKSRVRFSALAIGYDVLKFLWFP